MGFAVRGQAAHSQAGDTVEGGVIEDRVCRPAGRQRFGRRRAGMSLWLWRNPRLFAGKFGQALVDPRRYGWMGYFVKKVRFHHWPACLISK